MWALLSRLGIRYLVHERDVRYDFYKGFGFRVSDTPDNVRRILKSAAGITLVESFGQWDIYEISDPRSRVEIASGMVAVADLDARLMSRFATSLDSRATVYVAPEDIPLGAERLLAATAISGQLTSRSPAPPNIALADTGAMTDVANVPILGISTRYGDPEAWGEFEDLNPGETWRWFTLNNGEHYIVSNDSGYTVMAELSLEILSYARQRSFFVYLNSELLVAPDIQPDTPITIHIPSLRINSGENVLSFYSPYQADQRGGQNVTFAIRQHPRITRAKYGWHPAVPAGEYELRVSLHPFGDLYWPEGRPASLTIQLDGKPTELTAEEGSVSNFRKNLYLDESSSITIVQLSQENYFLQLIPEAATPVPTAPGSAEILQSSPSNHRVRVECDSPCVLIFNESFHEDWIASIDGRRLPHFEVDDYANAYLIDEPGTHVVDIEFLPQHWFHLAVLISMSATAITIRALVASRRRGRD